MSLYCTYMSQHSTHLISFIKKGIYKEMSHIEEYEKEKNRIEEAFKH